MLLGQRIKELRKRAGDTLKHLSDATGLSVSYLSDIERGRTNPSLQSLESLADHFAMSVADLLAGASVGGELTSRSLPPGLGDLLEDEDYGSEIDQDWVELLSKIDLRGQRPQTRREWLELYLSLKRILEKE